MTPVTNGGNLLGQLVLQAELPGHTDRVWHLSWSPSGPILASCSSDKSVRLHAYAPAYASTSQLSQSSEEGSTKATSEATSKPYNFHFQSSIPTSHNRTVRSLAFSPTGATLATASFDATVGIWARVDEAGVDDGPRTHVTDTAEWEPVDPLEGHESECKSVAWSSDGRLLASCSRDKSVWVWEAVGPAEFECLAVLLEHSQDVKSVTWHPKDELLASASYDDTVKLYAADPYDDEWTCTHTLEGHTATVWSVSFSPCGEYLASSGDDLVIKIWKRHSLVSQHLSNGASEAVRQEGGRMGPWTAGGVRIGAKERWKWDLAAEIKDMHERSIYSVDWADGGTPFNEGGRGRLLSTGGDGIINVFQMILAQRNEANLEHSLVASLSDAHGVSDVNHASWCRISPVEAARRLRELEGGEVPGDSEEAESVDVREDFRDPRWNAAQDLFATAGDDGMVKIFRVEMNT